MFSFVSVGLLAPFHVQTRTGLGLRIAAIRKQLGLREGHTITLDEFGKRVAEREQRAPGARDSGEVAYPKATVSRWERGVQIPRETTLRAIAELGDISVAELAAEVVDPRRSDLLAAQIHRADPSTSDAGASSADPRAPVPALAAVRRGPRSRRVESTDEAYSPALLEWLYRFLAEIATRGAGRLACTLAEYWLTRLVVLRAADPALTAVADDVVLLFWGEMAGAVRSALWEEGLLDDGERPPTPEPDPLDALGRRRHLTYPERRTLAPLGALARPTGFDALLGAARDVD